MKYVVSVALLGALAASPAFAAGMDKESGQSSSYQSGQSTTQASPPISNEQQSAAPSTSSTRSMQGAAADETSIRQAQQALKDKGYQVGEIDGVMGDNTRQALMKFQQDQGMQATGELDQKTIAALEGTGSSTQQGQAPSSESPTRGTEQMPGASSGGGSMGGAGGSSGSAPMGSGSTGGGGR